MKFKFDDGGRKDVCDGGIGMLNKHGKPPYFSASYLKSRGENKIERTRDVSKMTPRPSRTFVERGLKSLRHAGVLIFVLCVFNPVGRAYGFESRFPFIKCSLPIPVGAETSNVVMFSHVIFNPSKKN